MGKGRPSISLRGEFRHDILVNDGCYCGQRLRGSFGINKYVYILLEPSSLIVCCFSTLTGRSLSLQLWASQPLRPTPAHRSKKQTKSWFGHPSLTFKDKAGRVLVSGVDRGQSDRHSTALADGKWAVSIVQDYPTLGLCLLAKYLWPQAPTHE